MLHLQAILAAHAVFAYAAMGVATPPSSPPSPPSPPLASPEASLQTTPSGWSLYSAHCLGCHSQGGSAPLRLDTRSAIARKAPTIATVLREHFMPPWLPTGGGPFHHSSMTDTERAAIAAWATAGATDAPITASDATAERASPPPTTTIALATGWIIPADGVHMRTFVVHSPALPERVHAVRMTRDAAAVERAMVSVDPSGNVLQLDNIDPGDGAHTRGDGPVSSAGSFAMLGADSVWELPDHWSIRPGLGDLVVELHATGRGVATPAAVKLSFEAGEPTDRLAEVFAAGPLGAVRIERTDRSIRTESAPLVVDVEAGVLGLRIDERCTSVRVCAVAPDGVVRVLLDIPNYREGLDRSYRFAAPIKLVRGTNIRIETVHGDEVAASQSKPMVILWCARASTDNAIERTAASLMPLDPIALGELPTTTPADGVTWFDAVSACNARSARDGLAAAYRVEHAQLADGHIVRAQVTRIDGNGWRLPQASHVTQDPNTSTDQWLWTEDPGGLSAFTLVAPRDLRRDALPPSSRVSGVSAAITRPEVAKPAK
jgi:mono/diheme cytochrome c family protein